MDPRELIDPGTYYDFAALVEPITGGAAFQVRSHWGRVVKHGWVAPGGGSHHEAIYLGIIDMLEALAHDLDFNGGKNATALSTVVVVIDNDVVADQLNRVTRVVDPMLRPRAEKVWDVKKRFQAVVFAKKPDENALHQRAAEHATHVEEDA